MIQNILNNCNLVRKDSLPKKETLSLIKDIFYSKSYYFYLGYFLGYYLKKYGDTYDFHEIPEKYIIKLEVYLEILKGNNFKKAQDYFYEIITLKNLEKIYRDFLFGGLSFVLWEYMNNNKNINNSINIGLELISKAFSVDNYNYSKKLYFDKINKEKIICISGSGKKDYNYKLLNISSMSAIITASFGLKHSKNIIVSKVVSKATSSKTGSEDIFKFLGVDLNIPSERMLEVSKKSRIGVYSIGNIVPKLNHVYDNILYNVNVFAGLVGGPAIVNPIEGDLIYYGLTSGKGEITANILNKIYKKNILVINGEDENGNQITDQFSLNGYTNINGILNNQFLSIKILPKDFGIEYSNYDGVYSSDDIKQNAKIFLDLLSGKSNENLKNIVAMETTMQLFGLGIIKDLNEGFYLVKEVINSGIGIKVLKNIVLISGGNIKTINNYLKL